MPTLNWHKREEAVRADSGSVNWTYFGGHFEHVTFAPISLPTLPQ
jgi:hypothetical protein